MPSDKELLSTVDPDAPKSARRQGQAVLRLHAAVAPLGAIRLVLSAFGLEGKLPDHRFSIRLHLGFRRQSGLDPRGSDRFQKGIRNRAVDPHPTDASGLSLVLIDSLHPISERAQGIQSTGAGEAFSV